MSTPELILQLIVLFLFATGALAFGAMVKGCYFLRRWNRTTPRYEGSIVLRSPLVPSVSVLATAADASEKSRQWVRRLEELHFSTHEVVLVLNGASEEDLAVWISDFHLAPSSRVATADLPAPAVRAVYEAPAPSKLVLVRQEESPLPHIWNTGVNFSAHTVVALLDPDSEFEPTILLSLIRPMLEDPGRTIAVAGVMPPATPDGWAGRFRALEWLRLWLARCAAFAGWNLLLPVDGSSLLALRDAVVKTGGFVAGPLELFLNLHGHCRGTGKEYRVAFVPEAVGQARLPETSEELREAIARDQQELASVLRYRKSIQGGFRAIGWGLPGLLCVRWVRPLVETVALLLTVVSLIAGWIDLPMAGLVLLATVGLDIVISLAAVVLHELAEFHGSDPDRLAGLFFAAFPENLGYRQLRNLWLLSDFFRKPNPE